MGFKSDIEIAQECEMKPITEIAAKAGIEDKYLEQYGAVAPLQFSIELLPARVLVLVQHDAYGKERHHENTEHKHRYGCLNHEGVALKHVDPAQEIIAHVLGTRKLVVVHTVADSG